MRERLQREYARKGMSPAQLRHVTRFLDPQRPDVLTIGFARRFATYKRATLLLRDRARLARLVNDPERPVMLPVRRQGAPGGRARQAGAARDPPADDAARSSSAASCSSRTTTCSSARCLVSGVDVWLNNPIAPLEASGTSGIKAAINGRLNLSILDGWWAEGWMQDNGWGIPPANVQDPERRDALEAELILDTLEEEVLPLYYGGDESGCSAGVGAAQQARHDDRHPALQHAPRAVRLHPGAVPAGGGAVPAARRRRLRRGAHAGRMEAAHAPGLAAGRACGCSLMRARELPRGERLRLRVAASLNGLQPGRRARRVRRAAAAARRPTGRRRRCPPTRRRRATGCGARRSRPRTSRTRDGAVVFALDVEPPECGQFATEVRIYPWHELLSHPYELGLMKWL